jgi:glycosidase
LKNRFCGAVCRVLFCVVFVGSAPSANIAGVEVNREGSNLEVRWDFNSEVSLKIEDDQGQFCFEGQFPVNVKEAIFPKISSNTDLQIKISSNQVENAFSSVGTRSISPLRRPDGAAVIYQLPIRTWGAHSQGLAGRGKVTDISDEILKKLALFGIDYLWLTGVMEAASSDVLDEDIIKGDAGSYYAIYDSWDVSPQIGTMNEFEDLVKRAHSHGLRILIDLVPNHTARDHRTDVLCKSKMDFGDQDRQDTFFDVNNNYYYVLNTVFTPPGMFGKGDRRYDRDIFRDGVQYESPAKVTGNDVISSHPSISDWFETVKLNYGYNLLGSRGYFDPIPRTWTQISDIAKYWLEKGVDGFRIDFAHAVPIEFWRYFAEKVRDVKGDAFLLAEAYESDLSMKLPGFTYQAMYEAGFDSIYNSSLYWNFRNQATEPGNREFFRTENTVIDRDWVGESGAMFTHYMENHDEVRLASRHFAVGLASREQRAELGLAYTSFLSLLPGHMLIHGGQELQEDAGVYGSFAGDNGRTSIFDFVYQPQVLAWLRKDIKPHFLAFRDKYRRLLALKSQSPFRLSHSNNVPTYRNLYATNYKKEQNRWVGAYVRFDGSDRYLVVINSDPFEGHEATIHFTSEWGEDSHGFLSELQIVNSDRRYIFEDTLHNRTWRPLDPAIRGDGVPGWVLYRPSSMPSGLYLGKIPAGTIYVLKIVEL